MNDFFTRVEADTPPGEAPGTMRAMRAAWLMWLPWLLAVAFAGCCVVLLGLASSFRREAQASKRKLSEMARQAAALSQDVASWQGESKKTATNFQGRLTDFQRQLLQRAVEFERQKASLENQLKDRTAAHEQERANLQHQLAEKTAESQALREAITRTLADKREQFARARILTLAASSQTSASASAVGVVLWEGADQSGVVQVENLPPPPPGNEYQLWLHDPKYPVAISAGVLSAAEGARVRQSFKPVFPIEKLTQVSLSLELKGGSETPRGPLVMSGR